MHLYHPSPQLPPQPQPFHLPHLLPALQVEAVQVSLDRFGAVPIQVHPALVPAVHIDNFVVVLEETQRPISELREHCRHAHNDAVAVNCAVAKEIGEVARAAVVEDRGGGRGTREVVGNDNSDFAEGIREADWGRGSRGEGCQDGGNGEDGELHCSW